MHPLLPPVLLRARRLDELGEDPEPDPPDRERRESAQGTGGEGDAVIRPDELTGSPYSRNKRSKTGWVRPCAGCRELDVTAEEEAAVAIDDGQRIAVDPIAGAELAFEVGGPDFIGRGHGRRRTPGMCRGWPAWRG